jgi:replication factor C small subunit
MEFSRGIWNKTFLQKHKPQQLDQLIGNKHVIDTFNTFLKSNQLANMILTGESGIGKSTTINLLVKQYLGEELYQKDGKMYVYGTLYKSKDVVIENSDVAKSGKNNGRNVINFIKRAVDMGTKKKVVVFFDIDWMKETQMALRRVMEEYNDTYFILVCEDLSLIIEALQSRSIILHFESPTNNELYKYLLNVRNSEYLQDMISNNIVKQICLTANYNIRKGMIYLWIASIHKIENEQQFQSLFGITSMKLMKKLLMLCYEKKTKDALKLTRYIIKMGFSIDDIFQSMMIVLDLCKVSKEFELKTIDTISLSTVNNFYCQSYVNIYLTIVQLCS